MRPIWQWGSPGFGISGINQEEGRMNWMLTVGLVVVLVVVYMMNKGQKKGK